MKQSKVFRKAAQLVHADRGIGACLALSHASIGQRGVRRDLLIDFFMEDSPKTGDCIYHAYWLGPNFTKEDQQRRIYALLLASEWAKESE